jgi:hypothetical protein
MRAGRGAWAAVLAGAVAWACAAGGAARADSLPPTGLDARGLAAIDHAVTVLRAIGDGGPGMAALARRCHLRDAGDAYDLLRRLQPAWDERIARAAAGLGAAPLEDARDARVAGWESCARDCGCGARASVIEKGPPGVFGAGPLRKLADQVRAQAAAQTQARTRACARALAREVCSAAFLRELRSLPE